MDRRTYLRRAATAGVVSIGLLGGCAGSSTNDPADGTGDGGREGTPLSPPEPNGGADPEWHHPVGGTVDAVVGDRLFGREYWDQEGADGGVYALDVETGEHLWSYGETGGYHAYTELAATDAIFFGFGTDAIGDGSGATHALELDGEERWTADTGSVYDRPAVVDDVVYVGSDDRVVRAFDVRDGELRWSNDDVAGESSEVNVVAVADAVYVAAGELVALDRADGGVLWRYGDEGGGIREALVSDGVAYVADRDGIAAVSGGQVDWRASMESNKWIRGLESDRLLVRKEWDLHAFDAATGEERWVAEGHEGLSVDAHDGIVFVGSDRLYALRAEDGGEVWRTDVGDGGEVGSVTVLGDADDHTLFAQDAEDHLARLDADGEVTWEGTIDGRIRDYLVAGSVFVGSDRGIYALDPDTG